jgi:hypothetical protein
MNKWQVLPFGSAPQVALWPPDDEAQESGFGDDPMLVLPKSTLIADYLPGLCRTMNANDVKLSETTPEQLTDVLAQMLMVATAAFADDETAPSDRVSHWRPGQNGVASQDLEDAQRSIDNARNLKAPELLRAALQTKALLLIADNIQALYT